MKVNPRVHSHTIDRTEGNYVGEELSIHIIGTDESVIQFGSGDAHTVEEVQKYSSEYNVDIVIVEHADPDHYGGTVSLQSTQDVKIAAPAPDVSALKEKIDISIDYNLNDGELFHGIAPIATPGHTSGNMAFLYEDVLIAGDTVIGSDFDRAADYDWSGRLAMLKPSSHENPTQANQSVERLLEYDFDVVLVTHGSNVLKAGKDEVKKLIADLKKINN